MKLYITKIFTFDAAHRLPDYVGACSNLHGHQWTLEVEVSGKANVKTGMVIDFSHLKKIVDHQIIGTLDHTYLNDEYPNPTAEKMVESFVAIIGNVFEYDQDVSLERIRLYETPTSFVEWRK